MTDKGDIKLKGELFVGRIVGEFPEGWYVKMGKGYTDKYGLGLCQDGTITVYRECGEVIHAR